MTEGKSSIFKVIVGKKFFYFWFYGFKNLLNLFLNLVLFLYYDNIVYSEIEKKREFV